MTNETLIKVGRLSNIIIVDQEFIKEAINCYFRGQFKAMECIILEYGEKDFFTDLYQYMESEDWRRPLNKYMIYVGITIQFFKYSYNKPFEKI